MFLNTFIFIKALGLTNVYLGFSEFIPEGNNSWVASYTLNLSTTTQNLSMEMPHPLVLIGISVVTVFVHEILHLIFIPNFLTSDKTSTGITYFGGFSYTEEVITRTRYILMFLAPFILLSVLLPIVLNLLVLLSPLVILLMLFNAVGSSVDMLNLITVLVQVPAGAYITMNGMRTYWKKMDSTLEKA